jgi:hypothetical protein
MALTALDKAHAAHIEDVVYNAVIEALAHNARGSNAPDWFDTVDRRAVAAKAAEAGRAELVRRIRELGS